MKNFHRKRDKNRFGYPVVDVMKIAEPARGEKPIMDMTMQEVENMIVEDMSALFWNTLVLYGENATPEEISSVREMMKAQRASGETIMGIIEEYKKSEEA